MAAPGACAAARVGEGSRGAGRLSRPEVSSACLVRGCSQPQPPSKACTHSCIRDSLPIARPEHGKGRGAPSRPAPLRAPPRDFLRPAPPSGTQRTPLLVLKACLQSGRKRLLPQLWTGDGRRLSCFYLPTPPAPGFPHAPSLNIWKQS